MKSASVIGGLLVGCIIAGACGYFDPSGIDSAPAASFIWVHTFPLSVYGPLVLPTMILYIICACEAIGDITATCGEYALQHNPTPNANLSQSPIWKSRARFLSLACKVRLETVEPKKKDLLTPCRWHSCRRPQRTSGWLDDHHSNVNFRSK